MVCIKRPLVNESKAAAHLKGDLREVNGDETAVMSSVKGGCFLMILLKVSKVRSIRERLETQTQQFCRTVFQCQEYARFAGILSLLGS